MAKSKAKRDAASDALPRRVWVFALPPSGYPTEFVIYEGPLEGAVAARDAVMNFVMRTSSTYATVPGNLGTLSGEYFAMVTKATWDPTKPWNEAF